NKNSVIQLVFTQAENMSARRRPSVLRTEYQPQLIPSQNLQAVGEAVTDTSL
ncbi:unnamed protein product, partial [marine sediment metagenome]